MEPTEQYMLLVQTPIWTHDGTPRSPARPSPNHDLQKGVLKSTGAHFSSMRQNAEGDHVTCLMETSPLFSSKRLVSQAVQLRGQLWTARFRREVQLLGIDQTDCMPSQWACSEPLDWSPEESALGRPRQQCRCRGNPLKHSSWCWRPPGAVTRCLHPKLQKHMSDCSAKEKAITINI